ncbi:MAG: response regulator [Amphiplicatus sp.]
MNALDDRLLAAFRVEHKDHLEAVRAMLDACEGADWNGAGLDLMELHRRLHSLKGAARAVDMRPVEALAHALESLIEDCQAGLCSLDEESARTLRQALDGIEDWVDAALAEKSPPAIDALTRRIESARGAARPTSAAPAAPRQAPENASPPIAREMMRIETRGFDGLMQSAFEMLATTQQQEKLQSDLDGLRSLVRSLEQSLAARRATRRAPRGVPGANEPESAIAAVNEILRRIDASASWHRAHAWRLNRSGRRLQSQIQALRMISADNVFSSARKIVRDIAREQGKSVRVTVKGLETLADRSILEALKDPVAHILRNAVNHGIETPAERRRAGKPEEGLVALEIAARAGALVIRIDDDGRGVDRDKAVAVARQKGLLAATADAAAPSIETLLAFPGLSTAERVTEIAGRGMGLSVVKEAAARLGGAFSISPRAPCGVSVQITVPASLLAKRFVFVVVSNEIYCFPAARIERVHRILRRDVEMLDGRAHALFGEAPAMALAPLSFLLGRKDAAPDDEGALNVVELEGVAPRLGICVDAVLGVKDGLARDIGLDAGLAERVVGGVVLENGVVAPVLDIAALVETYRRADGGAALPIAAARERARAKSILVVDDSITTRTLEKSVLEASGFEVTLSVDGADALRKLRQAPVDLIISDIEMPNLDGFALVKALKQEKDLAKIPIILVTSRSDDADKQRGLELGADAYVVKQRFDQTELLSIIGRLL